MNVISLTQSLVQIPSVNPDGDPGCPDHQQGEAKIAHFLADLLSSLGAEVTLEEVLPSRPNLIARFPTDRPGKPAILLGPHTDTVGVAKMSVDPFAAELVDGRIYGRGACDTKGPMASMIQAIADLGADRIATLPFELHFVGFMSEESGQDGSRHFAQHHASRYAFAIAAEPTGCRVVHAHKGCTWASITLTGKAAHGARPELGHNAVIDAARLVSLLDTDFRPILAEHGGFDPALGAPTMNIGMLHGGTRFNIVPDHATIALDFRSNPQLDAAGGPLPLLQSFLDTQAPTATLQRRSHPAPALHTDPNNPYVAALAAIGPGLTTAPWFSDAAHLAAAGVPAVAAGPGDIAQAHTAAESISITDLANGVHLFTTFLLHAAP